MLLGVREVLPDHVTVVEQSRRAVCGKGIQVTRRPSPKALRCAVYLTAGQSPECGSRVSSGPGVIPDKAQRQEPAPTGPPGPR